MLLPLLLTGSAVAGPVDLYGFGAPQMGRGGGGVAMVDDPSGVFQNTAGLQMLERSQAMVGFAFLRSSFDPSPPLHWDTNRDGRVSEEDEPLDVGPEYDRADGFLFALGRPVGKRFGLAVAGFLPVDRLLRIQTFEASLPTWFMYQNRPHRYELALGFGWEQLPGISVGGGVEVIARARYSIAMTFDAVATGATEEDEQLGDLVGDMRMDVHEMTLDLVPSFAPLVGLHWDVGRLLPPLDGLVLGGTYRGAVGLPVDVEVDLQANVAVEDVGELEPLVVAALLPIRLDVFDHYVPERYAMGASYRLDEALRAYVDVTRTGWDEMRLNVAQVIDGELLTEIVHVSDPTVADGNGYEVRLRPTWGVRTGAEVGLPAWEPGGSVGRFVVLLRGGWGYEPTPLVSQGTESAFLDSDRMLFTGGLGVEHGDPFDLIEGPVSWDAFAQVHRLAEGSLSRPEHDPPDAGDPVGADTIPIGGHLWAAGVQWSIDY